VITLENHSSASEFTIGVCASDSARALPHLLDFLLKEDYGEGFKLRELMVVASGCEASTVSAAQELAASDPRVTLITEPERRGKAEAINRIIGNSFGENLIFLNSDAMPEVGAIRKLLSVAAQDPTIGCVSACPVFDKGKGLLQDSLGLMWSAHNLVSLRLNHAGMSNHSSDELLLVRRRFLTQLPSKLVNDGAYIGGLATSRGFRVKFSEEARVRIALPATPGEMISQRRRIIFGHVQVWKRLGRPPRTMESLLFTSPLLSVRLLVALLARNLRLIIVLPIVATSEIASALLALTDWALSTDRHAVWRRFE
jgi:cellulose synthase/poly-beta-1,6-N-acetylglucosamine synthase-like glycosyltransferase